MLWIKVKLNNLHMICVKITLFVHNSKHLENIPLHYS